jgi:mannose-6-phosphate isomerase-like protein (cupin superfamily)
VATEAVARVFRHGDGIPLGLPGRHSVEILSAKTGARAVTLRLVEIPVPRADEPPRAPHSHDAVDECIFVLEGCGTTHADTGEYPLQAGDTILLPAGERHVTRNTGSGPLRLLCFYPSGDVGAMTREEPV